MGLKFGEFPPATSRSLFSGVKQRLLPGDFIRVYRCPSVVKKILTAWFRLKVGRASRLPCERVSARRSGTGIFACELLDLEDSETHRQDACATTGARRSRRFSVFFQAVTVLFFTAVFSKAGETNSPAPVTARDFFNAGTRLLAATNFAEAERMFRGALAAQDETLQAKTEFNLGHTRFADGAEILKKGPDAQKVSAEGEAALAAGENALRNGEASQAENQLDKMIAAYAEGRGAQRELRAAEKIVKAAMTIYGKTLAKWQRADDDFKGAAELNPADTNATHNAAVVEREIAKLVDTLRKMQQMAGKLDGQKDQLGKMLSKLKGKIPAPDAPPGGKGEGEEDEDGSGKGDVKPESLAGKEENAGREGEEMQAPLSPVQAGQMLDGLPVDTGKRLPMGGDKQGAPAKDKNGRNW